MIAAKAHRAELDVDRDRIRAGQPLERIARSFCSTAVLLDPPTYAGVIRPLELEEDEREVAEGP